MQTAFVKDYFVDFDDIIVAEDSDGEGLTQAQVDFFHSSKCRDEESALLVVYHASKTDFTIFDPAKIGSGGGSIYGKGFYFCDNEYDITTYGSIIKSFYLNLTNPFIFGDMEDRESAKQNVIAFARILKANSYKVTNNLLNQLYRELVRNDGGIDTLIEQTCGEEVFVDYCKKVGYDGIMNRAIGDYVAFYPEQIKLCSNKNPKKTIDSAA